MPGFIVIPEDDITTEPLPRPSDKARYYYSFTWDITSVFNSDTDPALHNLVSSTTTKSPLIHLKNATLPSVTFGKESVKGASLEYKFAKDVSWNDISITWYDTEGMINVVKAWRKMVWSSKLGLNVASFYKRNTILYTYLPDSDPLKLDDAGDTVWKLFNSWPSSINYGELTYTSSDVKVVDVTVTYDWAAENYDPAADNEDGKLTRRLSSSDSNS